VTLLFECHTVPAVVISYSNCHITVTLVQVWGPDAAEFRPERWLEEGGTAQHVPPYSYMPFSRGPRNCIGAQFALLEAKTILSMMFRFV
jgi:hypothetical protein